MTIRNKRVLEQYGKRHADARAWLKNWLEVAGRESWDEIRAVRHHFPAADGGVKVRSGHTVTVFNVCGNKYRLIASVHYKRKIIVIHEIMTHAEYSKDLWKARY